MVEVKVEEHERFSGIYFLTFPDGTRRLATRNLTPGQRFYTEKLYTIGGVEYRTWDPFKSKLAAAILKGLEVQPIAKGKKVLYLGASTGTTVSHVSDIVGYSGRIFAVEFAHRVMVEFIDNVVKRRKNVVPIFADARKPESYSYVVPRVDVIYADLAQPDETEIAMKNASCFLSSRGYLMIAIKSRSIDVTASPKKIYDAEMRKLRDAGFDVLDYRILDPYEKDHAFVVARL